MLIAVFLDFFYQFDHVTRVGNHYKKNKKEKVLVVSICSFYQQFSQRPFSHRSLKLEFYVVKDLYFLHA